MSDDRTAATPLGTRLADAELARLATALRERGTTPAGPLRAEPIAGGRSNLTYRLTDGTSTWVLRTPPRAGHTPSAHDVAREFTVTSALLPTGVPVARPVLLVEDPSVLGVPFTVVEHVDARSLRLATELAPLGDAEVDEVVTRLIEVLAALHRVDHVAVGLERFGRPDAYAERQLRRWAGQWTLVGTPELAAAGERVAELLRARLPGRHHVSVVHGDYRLDNTLVRLGGATGGAEIAAVVDWELSTIGDPVADVALMCAYRDRVFDLIVGAPSSWTSPRLPEASGLAQRYERAGGVPLRDWEFHLALAYFKIGVIAAGIAHRHRAGAGDGAAGYAGAGESVARYFDLAHAALRGTA
ncbi:phosphotransferase family protein [Kitasatospora cineracea]|uniref:Aminoglycoside phosphotransferase (APT) family kinase protein n=1 Tax=Kitasatospora cineracea TaxID=88074 RepID=A0A8G1UKR7_9ACTN|nr:phosphotransferase family protein [Kitasatospora cineracea]ROR45792.1 aminoglycoside phosphotransferase (APT) family kinase protein [Kitasatospora cineracea]